MSLPQLYRNLVLTSYDRIRYRDGQPEGWGGASPFSMGLSTLVTRPHASLVHSMTLRGEWKEHELEEYASVGRVPDSSMMLNIALRAGIDRTTNLESFRYDCLIRNMERRLLTFLSSWELNTKVLETVYIGLSQLSSLTSLSLKFPSSRHPRPTTVIPPMPHLRSLKVTDIDPLCYPDDISTLLAKSRNLRDLKMHWSPRMQEAQEPSVILHDYFRECVKGKPLKLKKIGMQNLYARNTMDWSEAIDESAVEEVTFLSSPGLEDASSTFLHKTWVRPSTREEKAKLKSLRGDTFHKTQCEFLCSFSGLERLYIVNPNRSPYDQLNSPRQSVGPSSTTETPPRVEGAAPTTAASAGAVSPAPSHSPSNGANQYTFLRDSYFNNIVDNHGATLRHLLLPSRWPLSAKHIARLVHACPNLEELALAAEISAFDTLKLLLQLLRKLRAIRFLIPQNVSDKLAFGKPTKLPVSGTDHTFFSTVAIADIVELDDRIHAERMGVVMADKETFGQLRVVGLGWKAWVLGEFYTIPAETETQPPAQMAPGVVDGVRDQPAARNDPSGHTFTNGNIVPTGVAGPQGAVKETTATKKPTIFRQKGRPAPTPTTLPPASSTASSLGKHPRESLSPSTPLHPESQYGSGNLTPDITPNSVDDITEVLPSGEKVIWRRRVRRVGWEVLKHWEIWALDSQEL
jgi:hypothetical protein